MKKHLSSLFLILLLAASALLAACGEGECAHRHTSKTVFDPDCSLEGYVLHTCTDCGYAYKSDFKEPLGHVLIPMAHTPTCTEQGFATFTCTDCGYAYNTDYIAPLGHTMKGEVVTPTCETAGYTLYTCESECGYSYTAELVPPIGHDLVTAVSLATCTEGAYTRVFCRNCELDYLTDPGEPKGHRFTDTVVRPNVAQTGYTEHTCLDCGHSYRDNYVWYSDIFMGAGGEGRGILASGIDLSHHNVSVDWSALAATGIDYVILRAGYSGATDSMFESHYAGARAAGLDVGAYFYTYATTMAELQRDVEQLLALLEDKAFEYPIYFDLEDKTQEYLETELLMDMALYFCQTLNENGYFPGVYTNERWLNLFWNREQLTTYYDIWYARYPEDDGGYIYHPFGSWSSSVAYEGYGMWQYTEYGTIPGISGKVDLNFCYKDYPSLIKKYGYNNLTP